MATKLKKEKTKINRNITKERLAGTPFTNATELNAARQEILDEVWRGIERAKAKKELTDKEEYSFFLDPFKKGLLCRYGEKNDNLVRVFLGSGGIQIDINEDMKTSEHSEALLGALIKSMSESFLSNYLKSMGIIESSAPAEEPREANKRSKDRSGKVDT